ncbi:hypothetical protein C1H46_007829 [Malus baccata]|uniref:CCHC-type domain-containing protein n=1 Tax=Malus baccata TaxID=106549 RepID=A0A540N6A8_MALBA|nr:hypothetical protein C1H46_007829 [Malus baccata]
MSSQQSSFQQRPYYGGSQRNNGGYKYNKDRGNNGGSNQGGWTGNIDSRFNMQPECHICQRRGHTAPNCFHKNSASPTNFIECQICGKCEHIALKCYHRGNYAYQGSGPPAYL